MPEEPDERPAQRPSRSRRRGRPVTFHYPPESGSCDDEAALELLSEGNLEIEGRLVVASHATMYCTDRKIGHMLPVADGRLYGCDHGVCFGEEYKLRTVLWQWRGQKLPGRALTALGKLNAELDGGALATTLEELLSPEEVAATRSRIELLIEHRVHPYPPENWPAVPWPPG